MAIETGGLMARRSMKLRRTARVPVWRYASNEPTVFVDASVVLVLATIACAVGAPSLVRAQSLTHGQLSIPRAARGTIDLDSGNATFKVKNWGLVLDKASNGVNPADEPFTIGIAEERFLIPAGQLKASKNGKRFRYGKGRPRIQPEDRHDGDWGDPVSFRRGRRLSGSSSVTRRSACRCGDHRRRRSPG
jgi:hypothetical protein